MMPFIEQCRQLLGDDYLLTDAATMGGYLTDYRQRYTGRALAVCRPADTNELAQLIALCNQYQVAIVPQGGNTGLVLGSVPDQSGSAVVISLRRLNQVRALDPVNNTITVDAGCTLQQVQQAADAANRLFPLSLASEGSCTIGGNLSTNAGGTAVLHYGNARELCLGLEVVTPRGEIWNGLRGLRKDNTGYDLRDLYIGAEGTLGIISAAVLKLFPKPQSQVTALAAVSSVEAALDLFHFIRSHGNDVALTAFELISAYCLTLVQKHLPQMKAPPLTNHPYYVLIEFSSQQNEIATMQSLETVLQRALQNNLTGDVVIAASLAQSAALWILRESISDAQKAEGKNIKHDISLPISQIAEFIAETDAQLQAQFPGSRMVTFGHVGDGNLHYNVSAPENSDVDAFLLKQNQINRVVYDSVARHAGSISAEHGLGALKRDDIVRYKSAVEMQLMRTIKLALDPNNIMNPGKVVMPQP